MRPLHLFDPPQPIEVIAEVPDGPPHRFRWRRKFHEVMRFEGPERIASEWWKRKDGAVDRAGLTRDYYRVEDARGRRFWVFRHGLYEEKPQSPLVSPRAVRMTLRRAGRRDQLLLPARRLASGGHGRACAGAGHGGDRHRRPQQRRRRGARLCRAARGARAGDATVEEIAFRLVVGARLVFADGTPDIIAYPATRHGWGRLTRLLTVGNRRAEKGDCILHFADLLDHAEDLLLIVMGDEGQEFLLRRLAERIRAPSGLARPCRGRQRPPPPGQAQAAGRARRNSAARHQRRALRQSPDNARCTMSSPASAKA